MCVPRHLNDEEHSMFTCTGSVMPYRSMRYHALQQQPSMPDRVTVDEHLRGTDRLDMVDPPDESFVFAPAKAKAAGKPSTA